MVKCALEEIFWRECFYAFAVQVMRRSLGSQQSRVVKGEVELDTKPTLGFNASHAITHGLEQLLTRISKISAHNLSQKLLTMQELYVQNHPDTYTEGRVKQIRYYLKVVLYKFELANLSLEQLWALSETKRGELISVLENAFDTLGTSDDELLLMSFAFEGVLFQTMACLEFYLLYLCYFLQLLPVDYRGKMTTNKFFTILERAQENGAVEKVSLALGLTSTSTIA